MMIFEPKNLIDPESALQMEMFDYMRNERLEELSNIDHELNISIVEDVTMDPTNFRHSIFDELSPYLLRGGVIDPEEMFSTILSYHHQHLEQSLRITQLNQRMTQISLHCFKKELGVISGELPTLKSKNKLIQGYKKFKNPIISPITRQLSAGSSSRTLSTQKTSFKRNHIDSVEENDEEGGGEEGRLTTYLERRGKRRRAPTPSFMGFLPSIK